MVTGSEKQIKWYEEILLDEVKLTGGVVEEVRIVPVGNKFTLEGDEAWTNYRN